MTAHTPLGKRPFWHEDAACRGLDPDVFHPVETDPRASAPAKAICAPCPVKAACLDHALANSERFGVWGGMTEAERRREARRRRQATRRRGRAA